MPDPILLQGDGRLTQLAVDHGRILDAQFVADTLFPLTPAPRLVGKYVIFDKDDYDPESDVVSAGGNVELIDFAVSMGTYTINPRALLSQIPLEEQADAQAPIDPAARRTQLCVRKLKLRTEIQAAAVAFGSTFYDASLYISHANAAWTDPIGDINAAINKCLAPPDTMVFGLESWSYLRTHANILKAVKPIGQGPGYAGLATGQEVADLFGLNRVVIGKAKYNSAKRGQTRDIVPVFGTHLALIRSQRVDDFDPILATQINWTGAPGSDGGYFVMTGIDPKAGAYGIQWVKCARSAVFAGVEPLAGYLFANIVATAFSLAPPKGGRKARIAQQKLAEDLALGERQDAGEVGPATADPEDPTAPA